MQILLTEDEYADLKRKADAYDAQAAAQTGTQSLGDGWSAWDAHFRKDFKSQQTYIGAKTLMNTGLKSLKAYAEADPTNAAALKAWLKTELANKQPEPC